MGKLRRFVGALCLLMHGFVFANASAQQGEVDPALDGLDAPLEELLFRELEVVTIATRTEKTVLDSPGAVSVITAEEIRDSGATTLPELLSGLPGVDTMALSSSDANVTIRGFNRETGTYMLVMIDGRSVYVDTFGSVTWSDLNVAMQEIERIEIVRGPTSALYGANALLGTVNIVTKRARDLPSLYARVAAGNDAGLATATAARTSDRIGAKASVEYAVQDHFRNRSNPGLAASHRRGETGLRTRKASAAFDVDLGDGRALTVSTGLVRRRTEILSPTGSFDNSGADMHAELDYRSGPWKAQAFFLRSDADIETSPTLLPLLPPQRLSGRIESNTFDVEIQRALEWRQHSLVLGVNARRLTTKLPLVLGARESETIYALFAQDEIQLTPDLTAYAGVRLDDHATTGLNASPRASLVWKLGEAERIRLSFARSFRQPSQVLSYASMNMYGGLVRLFGNEELDPVWTTSYELGFQGRLHPKVLGRLDVFYYVIEDFIDMQTVSFFPTVDLTFQNGGRTRVWGAEAEVSYKLRDRLDGFATYSFQSAHGPNEFSTPRHKASLGLRGKVAERVRFHAKAVYVGHTRFEPEPLTALVMGDLSLRSRFTVDAFAGYAVRPGFELGVRATNLFHQVRRHHPLGDEIGSRLLLTATVEF